VAGARALAARRGARRRRRSLWGVALGARWRGGGGGEAGAGGGAAGCEREGASVRAACASRAPRAWEGAAEDARRGWGIVLRSQVEALPHVDISGHESLQDVRAARRGAGARGAEGGGEAGALTEYLERCEALGLAPQVPLEPLGACHARVLQEQGWGPAPCAPGAGRGARGAGRGARGGAVRSGGRAQMAAVSQLGGGAGGTGGVGFGLRHYPLGCRGGAAVAAALRFVPGLQWLDLAGPAPASPPGAFVAVRRQSAATAVRAKPDRLSGLCALTLSQKG
jgi:hypothetical protein